MANRRRQTGPARGPRRMTNWTYGFISGPTSIAVGGAAALTLLNPEDGGAQNGTLIRVRGEIGLHAESVLGVNGLAAFGIAVVEERAFLSGIANNALPRPISEGGDDIWLWHSTCRMDGTSADSQGQASVHSNCVISVDSKAMRKYEDNVRVILVAESRTVAFNFTYGLRLLSKFH